jgi:hypothetical protein
MLLIFRDFIASRAAGLKSEWKDELAKLGTVLEKERKSYYAFF